jgi:competence protein ComEA
MSHPSGRFDLGFPLPSKAPRRARLEEEPMDRTVPVASFPDRPPPRRSPADRVRDWVGWFGVGRLVAGAVSLLALLAAGFWLLRAPRTPVETSLPMASSTPPGSTTAAATTTSSAPDSVATVPAEIVVHVAGAVREPGVRRLPPGARVVDAVAAAGGLAAGAAADAVNLAALLSDGDRIYVPRAEEATAVPAGVTPTTTAASGPSPPGPVQVNTAGAAELETLPGIGPAIAAAIVAYRDQHGPFLTVDQLADVPGIGPSKLASLRELVTT